MLKSIIKWFATKKGESAANQVNKQLENDPEYQKDLEELKQMREQFGKTSNRLNSNIDGLMEVLDEDEDNDKNKD